MSTETKKWIESVVVGLNLCPFAGSVMKAGKVRYVRSDAQNHEELMQDLLTEIDFLLSADPNELETTFLIHPDTLNDFPLYLDFIDMAEELLEEGELESLVQIAGFHPDYTFDDTDYDDPANYTNRSPYPMLHLLRGESLESAIEAYGDTSEIPVRNIALMRELGLEKVRQMREDCFE
ncbi:MAG: DUF1415 domain-containing protein [Bacteroidia bacterium]